MKNMINKTQRHMNLFGQGSTWSSLCLTVKKNYNDASEKPKGVYCYT